MAGGAVSNSGRAPRGVDPYKPNSARAYNYMLGGKDNYEADQEYARRVLAVAPDSRILAQASRGFLIKGVRTAAEAGVRQFIDLGAGIPISPNVYEIAQGRDPSAQIVCVDNDPVVYMHCTASLSGLPGVTPILADVRDPGELIERLRDDELIDFDKPVAVLMVGVLHFVMDAADPAGIIARFRDEMVPGSYFVVTHVSDESDPIFVEQARAAIEDSPIQVTYRSRNELTSYLDGFEILDPGVVRIQEWLDDPDFTSRAVIIGCVCRRP